jgi:hypothetical protein
MSLESLGIFSEGSKIDRQESIAPSRCHTNQYVWMILV